MKARTDNIRELNANNIFVFDDFLSSDQCNEILFSIDTGLWEGSRVVSVVENQRHIDTYSNSRTSKTIFEYLFSSQLKQLITAAQHQITLKTNISAEKLEGWQITRYGFEEKFEYHIDGGFLKDDPAGEREKTILLYLMSPIKGGETHFRALNLYVRPIQGRLVIWDNLLPNGNSNYAMMHAGLPVKKGVKIILNTWSRLFLTIKP